VPDRIVTTPTWKMVDTTDEWIVSRTGISSAVAATDQYTSDLGLHAALRAIEKIRRQPRNRPIIVATITPDMPSLDRLSRQQKIGAYRAAAFDIEARARVHLGLKSAAIHHVAHLQHGAGDWRGKTFVS